MDFQSQDVFVWDSEGNINSIFAWHPDDDIHNVILAVLRSLGCPKWVLDQLSEIRNDNLMSSNKLEDIYNDHAKSFCKFFNRKTLNKEEYMDISNILTGNLQNNSDINNQNTYQCINNTCAAYTNLPGTCIECDSDLKIIRKRNN